MYKKLDFSLTIVRIAVIKLNVKLCINKTYMCVLKLLNNILLSLQTQIIHRVHG